MSHINNLCKKLITHGIELVTLYKFGFELRQGDRDKIRELLAKYGARLKPDHRTQTDPGRQYGGVKAANALSDRLNDSWRGP